MDFMVVAGAEENNLKCLTVKLPLAVLCGITGVSGSGKSTLMNQTVMPRLRQRFGERVDKIGKHEYLTTPAFVRNVIVIDQDPIGQDSKEQPSDVHEAVRRDTPNICRDQRSQSPRL